jgi:hypothetical protein
VKMSVKSFARKMQDKLDGRVRQLKQMPLSEIEGLPAYSDEGIFIEHKEFTLATWKEQHEDGTLEIVVQAYRRGFLGIGIMIADGFLMGQDGEIRPLPDEIRWKYC